MVSYRFPVSSAWRCSQPAFIRRRTTLISGASTSLLAWALWALRSRRYSLGVWVAIVVVAGVAGYFGQRGITQAQRYFVAFNAQWIARFMRRADDPFKAAPPSGASGRSKTLTRSRSACKPHTPRDVPVYLREATYRVYGRQTWFAGSSKDDFTAVNEVPPSPTNRAHWPLVLGKSSGSVVNIACYLDGSDNGVTAGLLPLPSGAARLEKSPTLYML